MTIVKVPKYDEWKVWGESAYVTVTDPKGTTTAWVSPLSLEKSDFPREVVEEVNRQLEELKPFDEVVTVVEYSYGSGRAEVEVRDGGRICRAIARGSRFRLVEVR